MAITSDTRLVDITLPAHSVEFSFSGLPYSSVDDLSITVIGGITGASEANPISVPRSQYQTTTIRGTSLFTGGTVTAIIPNSISGLDYFINDGGTVKFKSGVIFRVTRTTPLSQLTQFPGAGRISPKDIEKALDKTVIGVQDFKDQTDENTTGVATNRTDIESNRTSIATNARGIATNRTDIAANRDSISDLGRVANTNTGTLSLYCAVKHNNDFANRPTPTGIGYVQATGVFAPPFPTAVVNAEGTGFASTSTTITETDFNSVWMNPEDVPDNFFSGWVSPGNLNRNFFARHRLYDVYRVEVFYIVTRSGGTRILPTEFTPQFAFKVDYEQHMIEATGAPASYLFSKWLAVPPTNDYLDTLALTSQNEGIAAIPDSSLPYVNPLDDGWVRGDQGAPESTRENLNLYYLRMGVGPIGMLPADLRDYQSGTRFVLRHLSVVEVDRNNPGEVRQRSVVPTEIDTLFVFGGNFQNPTSVSKAAGNTDPVRINVINRQEISIFNIPFRRQKTLFFGQLNLTHGSTMPNDAGDFQGYRIELLIDHWLVVGGRRRRFRIRRPKDVTAVIEVDMNGNIVRGGKLTAFPLVNFTNIFTLRPETNPQRASEGITKLPDGTDINTTPRVVTLEAEPGLALPEEQYTLQLSDFNKANTVEIEMWLEIRAIGVLANDNGLNSVFTVACSPFAEFYFEQLKDNVSLGDAASFNAPIPFEIFATAPANADGSPPDAPAAPVGLVMQLDQAGRANAQNPAEALRTAANTPYAFGGGQFSAAPKPYVENVYQYKYFAYARPTADDPTISETIVFSPGILMTGVKGGNAPPTPLARNVMLKETADTVIGEGRVAVANANGRFVQGPKVSQGQEAGTLVQRKADGTIEGAGGGDSPRVETQIWSGNQVGNTATTLNNVLSQDLFNQTTIDSNLRANFQFLELRLLSGPHGSLGNARFPLVMTIDLEWFAKSLREDTPRNNTGLISDQVYDPTAGARIVVFFFLPSNNRGFGYNGLFTMILKEVIGINFGGGGTATPTFTFSVNWAAVIAPAAYRAHFYDAQNPPMPMAVFSQAMETLLSIVESLITGAADTARAGSVIVSNLPTSNAPTRINIWCRRVSGLYAANPAFAVGDFFRIGTLTPLANTNAGAITLFGDSNAAIVAANITGNVSSQDKLQIYAVDDTNDALEAADFARAEFIQAYALDENAPRLAAWGIRTLGALTTTAIAATSSLPAYAELRGSSTEHLTDVLRASTHRDFENFSGSVLWGTSPSVRLPHNVILPARADSSHNGVFLVFPWVDIEKLDSITYSVQGLPTQTLWHWEGSNDPFFRLYKEDARSENFFIDMAVFESIDSIDAAFGGAHLHLNLR